MHEWATKPAAVDAADARPRRLAAHVSARSPAQHDTARAIFGQEKPTSDGFYASSGIALALHAAFFAVAIATGYLDDIRALMQSTRADLHEFLWAQYDVDLTPKPPPKVDEPPPPTLPPEPESAPAPPPPAAAKVDPKDDPYEQPPPAPAEAAKVLVQDSDPDKIEDMTGDRIVTGEGTAAYGHQSASGKGNTPVTSPYATLKGTPGGTGTGTAAPPPPPPGPDLSRAASLVGSTQWNCAFPAEADADQIDLAVVSIVVSVRPDGSPLSVSVLKDPGHGFGRAARICALGRRYTPTLDRTGTAIVGQMPPINVRFSR